MTTVALIRPFAFGVATLCLCTGCLGTETGNPSETRNVSMAMVLKCPNPQVVTGCVGETEAETQGTPLNVKNAWLATNYLNIRGCNGADASNLGRAAWDFRNPVARHFQTQLSSFCGFDFQTQPADASFGSIPAGLSGFSIWIQAIRTDNVTVEIQTPAVIEIAKPNSTSPNTSSALVIALDAAAWLGGIDFNALSPGADGIVHVTDSSNAPVLQVLEQQASADVLLRTEASDDGVTDN